MGTADETNLISRSQVRKKSEKLNGGKSNGTFYGMNAKSVVKCKLKIYSVQGTICARDRKIGQTALKVRSRRRLLSNRAVLLDISLELIETTNEFNGSVGVAINLNEEAHGRSLVEISRVTELSKGSLAVSMVQLTVGEAVDHVVTKGSSDLASKILSEAEVLWRIHKNEIEE